MPRTFLADCRALPTCTLHLCTTLLIINGGRPSIQGKYILYELPFQLAWSLIAFHAEYIRHLVMAHEPLPFGIDWDDMDRFN